MRRVDGLRQYIAKALDGKSNKLFELFGMKYDAAVTVDMFLGHISVDNRTNDFPNI